MSHPIEASQKSVQFIPHADTLLAAGATAEARSRSGRVPERSELAEKDTWDLGSFYADLSAWEADFAKVSQGIKDLAGLSGQLAESPEKLLHVLRSRDRLYVRFERLIAYAMLLKDQDTRQGAPQAMADRAGTLSVRLGEAVSWLEPELLAVPEETIWQWCEANEDLAVYRHYFDNILRLRKHVLTAREEALLAMGGKVAAAPQQAFSLLTNADMKFPSITDEDGNEVELSEGRFGMFMQSTHRPVRQQAYEGLMNTYHASKNAIGALLAGSVQKDVFYARTHNYASALEAALSPDNIGVEVYDNLIATVRQHLPKLHRYLEIRRKRLKLDKVHAYDTSVPLVDGEPPRIGYDDAVALINEATAPLGEAYLEPMKAGFTSRWVDVYEAQGKRSGAYSMGIYEVHPYILLNYNGTYRDMFTVTHEMGHSMHTWFTQHHQPEVYGDYPIFLAEVASTANEALLGHYLRERAASRDEKLYLVNLAVEGIRGTVINQVMWAEFEKVIHAEAEAGGALTYETLAAMYRKITLAYMGPSYQHDELVDGYWLRIPHFYRGFYVYKYATSYCAAAALTKRILDGVPNARNDYLGFLKSGCSHYPIDTLKRAGVDLSTPQPIHDTMNLFGELLDDLEGLLG